MCGKSPRWPGERVGAVEAVGVVGFDERRAVFDGQGEGLDARGLVTDAGVTDRAEVGGDTLDDGGGTGLLLDGGLVVTVLQGVVLEEAVGTGSGVTTEGGDGLTGESAGQLGITPGGDVLATALAGGGEDAVYLREGETSNRVVFVDEDGESIDGDGDLGRLVAELTGEASDFGGLHLAAHRANLGGTGGESNRGGARTLTFNLDVDVGVLGLESFAPESHEVIKGVGTDRVQVTRDAGGNSVIRELGVNGDDISGGRGSGLGGSDSRREGEQREGLEGGVHVCGNESIISCNCYGLVSAGCFLGNSPQPFPTPKIKKTLIF